jgi:hypothetical protein
MPTSKAHAGEIRIEDRRSETAWDWSAEWDGEHERQVAELEAAVADLGTKVAGLQGQLERTRIRERELRKALADLASAGFSRRRKVVARLRGHGLI